MLSMQYLFFFCRAPRQITSGAAILAKSKMAASWMRMTVGIQDRNIQDRIVWQWNIQIQGVDSWQGSHMLLPHLNSHVVEKDLLKAWYFMGRCSRQRNFVCFDGDGDISIRISVHINTALLRSSSKTRDQQRFLCTGLIIPKSWCIALDMRKSREAICLSQMAVRSAIASDFPEPRLSSMNSSSSY